MANEKTGQDVHGIILGGETRLPPKLIKKLHEAPDVQKGGQKKKPDKKGSGEENPDWLGV